MTDRHRLWELDRRGRSARVWPRLPGRRPRAPSRAEERAGRASRAPARAHGSDRCDRPEPVSAERGPCRPCKCSPPASSEAGPRPQFGFYCTHVSSSPLCSNHKRGGCYGDWTGGAEPVNGRGSGPRRQCLGGSRGGRGPRARRAGRRCRGRPQRVQPRASAGARGPFSPDPFLRSALRSSHQIETGQGFSGLTPPAFPTGP